MSTVAEQLRQAREAKKLTVHQVAEVTKIRTDHIRALEEGNFDVFAAPVYIRGFVRSYATLLKMDVPQTMSALDAELGRTEKYREPPPLTEQTRSPVDFVTLQLSKVDWRKGAIVLGTLAALGFALLIWRHYRSRDPMTGLKPGLYQSTNRHSGESIPVPAAPQRR